MLAHDAKIAQASFLVLDIKLVQPGNNAYFGPFEVDLRSGEVRKHGFKVRLQEKPFELLATLLKRPGEVIPREELHQVLWPNNHFVEFDHNLNNAINKLREALCDSSEEPRYLETLPRRGYRFIAPVSWNGENHQTEALPALTPTNERSAKRTSARRIWLALASSAAVLLLASLAVLYASLPQKNKIAFKARDWVLITNFENRTGERLLDGTLEFALERELSNSQFVNVVPRERVSDTLGLMRKSLDSKIDSALGREICLRDGGIRALLTGRIEKFGARYLLTAVLVDPAKGTSVASVSEEAGSQNELLPAVQHLSHGVRLSLGEKLPQIKQQSEKLEKVTTPSLRALQLYSQGIAAVDAYQWDTAITLFEQALAEDPQFASAHIYLAHSYSNMQKREEAALHYRRAFALAKTTTDRERYFILGSYYQRFSNDDEKSVQPYEALVRLYPDDYWGTNNLSMVYWSLGRNDEAIALSLQSSKTRPNSFTGNVHAALDLVEKDKNLARAKPYLLRAQALASPETIQLNPYAMADMLMVPAYAHWVNGEAALARDDARVVEQSIGSRSGREREAILSRLAEFYLALGKFRAAEALYQKIGDANEHDDGLGWYAYFKNNFPAAREHISHGQPWLGMERVVVMARMGYLADAGKILESTATRGSVTGGVEIARGELALAQGRTQEGLTLIQNNLHLPLTISLFGMESLAAIYERRGNLPAAANALEKAYSAKSPWLIDDMRFEPLYFRIGCRLAQVYRKLGRIDDAKIIEDELRKLLAVADPDHPILLELQKRPQTYSAALTK